MSNPQERIRRLNELTCDGESVGASRLPCASN